MMGFYNRVEFNDAYSSKRSADPPQRTIGFLSTWSVYEGTTIDRYTRTLMQGICAAARDHGCNLLVACGIGLPGTPRGSRTAWAVPGPGNDFIPVGPWNTDGLIIIPDDLSAAQFEYVQDLINSDFPVILTTAEKPGPIVAVDNKAGIQQAFDHLWEHGHRRIAFIAGKSGRGGDSAERLAAYRKALRRAGLKDDWRLIAFGEHRYEDGRQAMQQILATGAMFTAVLASNDLSCIGAVKALQAAGRRVPDDVAVIGFDDILDARSHLPPLTTVRHPTFLLGYEAVSSLLVSIGGKHYGDFHKRVPTQLVIRQSCGCHPKSEPATRDVTSIASSAEISQTILISAMAEATLIEARHSSREDIEVLCSDLVRAFISSMEAGAPTPFDDSLQRVFDWLEAHEEDAYPWHAAFSTLRRELFTLLPLIPGADFLFAGSLIDRARLEVDEHMQRQATDTLLRHMEISNRLGLMTSQLLSMLDASESTNVLAHHLPYLGIQHVLVALYESREDDPLSHYRILLDAGLPESNIGRCFPTRAFPPPGMYPADSPFQLALLPLTIDDRRNGFVAFSATNLEPCAAITYNLASALRTSRLYHDALEGQKLAEDANRLKSRFLSMVSHELRTPLSLIVGLSDMVVREQHENPGLTGDALRDIEQINASARHLARLIGDVLDLASSEAGQLRIQLEPIDLVEALHVAAMVGEQLAREKGLAWCARLPDQGLWVLGNRTRLRQVALNLISNAVKFTATGTILLEVKADDHQVTVAVSDTGLGILPGEQASLFREFHRTERSIQSGYGGLGLGLVISKQLIERHGGTIGVNSPGDLSAGSTFFFTLPILKQSSPFLDPTALPRARDNPVVLLTDQAGKSDQLYSFLHARGFEVRVFNIEEDAEWLSQLAGVSPAALILDDQLATREGWTLIALLKRQPALEHTPLVVYKLNAEQDQGTLLELNYLHKPLSLEQLAVELAREGASSTEQRVVLVVDDDPGILDLHCRLVEQAGCQAIKAHNGIEALKVFEHTHPDLILLDLMMPVMDGFETLEALRTLEATRDIPVIIMTARPLTETDIELCTRRVATILNKGMFDAAETLKHIEAALARQYKLGSATQRLVRRAMAFIHEHYAAPLSREDIANHISISADYLTDCFRQEFGVTPITYLNRYRIRQARTLLETGDQSITEIAQAVGFSESAHFSRTFQREVGVTPRAYRRGRRRPPAG